MFEPTIDVIVPHYNSSLKLERLLNSIPKRDWIKILVIDDHSQPDEKENLKTLLLKFPNARYFEVPIGLKGPGNARNVGIEEGDGEWVIFADCDDYFSDNALDCFEHVRKKDVDVVYYRPDSRVEGLDKQGKRHEHYQSLLRCYLKSGNPNVFYRFYAPWSKFIKKGLIEKHSIFFDDGVGGEDNNFSLKVAFFSDEFLVMDQTLYVVTESEHSLTGDMSETVLINHFKAMSRYNDFLQSHNLSKYQAPMLGWLFKARKIGLGTVFKWLLVCIKHGYPISPHYYFKFAFRC